MTASCLPWFNTDPHPHPLRSHPQPPDVCASFPCGMKDALLRPASALSLINFCCVWATQNPPSTLSPSSPPSPLPPRCVTAASCVPVLLRRSRQQWQQQRQQQAAQQQHHHLNSSPNCWQHWQVGPARGEGGMTPRRGGAEGRGGSTGRSCSECQWDDSNPYCSM